MVKRSFRIALVIASLAVRVSICVGLFASGANADPISYTFTGTGTGTFGGIAFTNSSFTISLFSDTTNLVIVPGSPSSFDALLYMPGVSSQIAVASFGCATFTTGKRIFLNGTALGFAHFADTNIYDILDIRTSAFSSYDLVSSFPLMSNLSPSGPVSLNDPTSVGFVSLTSAANISFQAVVGAFTAPQIVLQPTNQAALAGDSVSLGCQASGTAPLAFQWLQNGTPIPGAVNPTLLIPNAQAGNAGDYTVIATNLIGTVTSQVATVTVNASLPIFTAQPVSQTSFIGSNTSFSVSLKGSQPISSQWYLNNGSLSGATNTALAISNVQTLNAGMYFLVASNQIGMATSQVAALTVVTTPVFTQQPLSQGCPNGATVSLSAAAQGSGVLGWQWYSNGTAIIGATSSRLSVTNVQIANPGNYWVVVSNSNGSATSGLATLTFSPLIAWGYSSNNLTAVPPSATNVVAFAGGDYHIVISRADGSLQAWGLDSAGQTDVPSWLTNVQSVAAGSTHSLALQQDATVAEWGRISGDGTTVSPSATNVVSLALGPSAWHALALRANGTVVDWGYSAYGVTFVPSSATNVVAVAAGGNHALALRGDGTVLGWGSPFYGQTAAPATATNMVAIAAGLNHSLGLRSDGRVVAWGDTSHGQGIIPISATNIVAIACGENHSIALRSDGAAVVWGDNSYGQTTVPKWATNLVGVAGTGYGSLGLVGDGPPVITTPMVNRSAVFGSTAVLRAAAVGARPLSYQWRFNGMDLTGATNGILAITNLQPNQVGSYSIVVTNSLGAVTSSSLVLGILTLLVTSQPQSQTALAGANVPFSVTALGQTPMNFQWRFNGSDLAGATSNVLGLSNIVPAQAGMYSVVVSNASTVVTSSVASLAVIPLSISAQPQNAAAQIGAGATFGVNPVLQGPFSFQWLFNGTPLTGATVNPLALTNLLPSQSGIYSVVVANPYGTTNSTGAVLSVLNEAGWGNTADGATAIPSTVTNAIGIAAGFYHSIALKADGTVTAWGNSGFGQTNVGLVRGLTNIVGIGAAGFDSMAIKADGKLLVWGYNIDGEANVPANLSNVVATVGGEYYVTALKSDGTVVSWGDNTYGQTNTAGLTNIVMISAGGGHTLGLKADGTMVAWGRNDYGQSTLPADLTNVIGVAGGYVHTMALKADGTVVAWGDNEFGQTNVPPGLSNVVAIAGGCWHSLALQSDGTIVAWGRNDYGQSTVPTGLMAVAIAAGDFHSLALLGTNPPVLQALLSNPTFGNSGFSMSIPTQSGRVYALEYKHSLEDSNWTALPLFTGTGRAVTVSDPTADGSQRFYRIRRW